jgi:hypothetical protein
MAMKGQEPDRSLEGLTAAARDAANATGKGHTTHAGVVVVEQFDLRMP